MPQSYSVEILLSREPSRALGGVFGGAAGVFHRLENVFHFGGIDLAQVAGGGAGGLVGAVGAIAHDWNVDHGQVDLYVVDRLGV